MRNRDTTAFSQARGKRYRYYFGAALAVVGLAVALSQSGIMGGKNKFGSVGTASFASFIRYCASFESDPRLRTKDRLAGDLLPGMLKVVGSYALPRGLAKLFIQRKAPSAYELLAMRSQVYDAVIENHLGNVDQYLLLGAGFDTRPYRYAKEIVRNGVRTFEVDLPAIQQSKKHALAAARASVGSTEHVQFVPTNLNEDGQLLEQSKAAGFNVEKVSLVTWEGVTYYLEEVGVDATLMQLSEMLPSGSLLQFDYIDVGVIQNPQEFFGGEAFINKRKDTDEPIKFGLDPEQVPDFLAKYGFDVVENIHGEAVRSKIMKEGSPLWKSAQGKRIFGATCLASKA